MFNRFAKKWRGAYLAGLLAVFFQILLPVGQVFPSSFFSDEVSDIWQPLVICAAYGGYTQASVAQTSDTETPITPNSSVFTEDCAVCQLRALNSGLLVALSNPLYSPVSLTHQKDIVAAFDSLFNLWSIIKSPRAPPYIV